MLGHACPVISFNLPLYAPNCSEFGFSEIRIQTPDHRDLYPQIYFSVDAGLTGPPYHHTQPDR